MTQLSTKCLAHFGYFLQSGTECVVIDPLRDLDAVRTLITQSNCTLKAIILTHFHADFVAGHFDLKKEYGCPIIMGPSQEEIEGVLSLYQITL